MTNAISFIHISDIHFNKYSSNKYDVDIDVRNEFGLDIENAKQTLQKVDGILICGDIAFSGQKCEYDVASTFLTEICNKLNISEAMVYCVPGNHDVDQHICEKRLIKHLQHDLEICASQTEIDSTINSVMTDCSTKQVIFEPLKEYNKFAEQFCCSIDADKPYWTENIKLGDYTLHIRGINSVIISSKLDQDINDRSMIIGRYQIPLRSNNCLTLTLCHHPPELWKDEQCVRELINSRAHIQLYGHKHIPTWEEGTSSLIIGSGAIQPSRTELGWVPYYNWITILFNDENQIEVRIYPRIFRNNKFVNDIDVCDSGECFKTYPILMDPNVNNYLAEKVYELDELVQKRTIAYGLINLPQMVRTRLMRKYTLLEENEYSTPHHELLESIIKRAEQKHCLEPLMNEINKY